MCPAMQQKHIFLRTAWTTQVCRHYYFRRFLNRSAALVLAMGLAIHVQAAEVSVANMPSDSTPILLSVIEQARASALEDYRADDHDLNDALKSMDYQTYRAIRFDASKSLWHDENDYEVQFFHPGFLYQQPVSVVQVDSQNQVHPVAFDSDLFRYDGSAQSLAGLTDANTGFAGFRVHYPIKNNQYKDEFAVFLGASYFRLVGKNQVYGISARGLAVDTALPKGEEFPHFTQFWLIEPAKGEPLTVYARLESPSVAGAYKFVITPGVDTKVEVQAWLFARNDVTKLGVAPFTSMFLYGENTPKRPDDYRPEVHDSDGVMMVTGNDETIWRPLTNPARLQITSLSAEQPKGFGMLQRDTQWQSYLDAEANYHLRPGLWVAPHAGFGKGRLELVEIPTRSETHDNIVAYWVMDEPFVAGQSRYLSYTLSTVEGMGDKSALAQVELTRQGASVLPGEKSKDTTPPRQFVVDFALPAGQPFSAGTLALSLSTSKGKISQPRVYPVKGGTALRAVFLLTPQDKEAADMRLYVTSNDQRISEVWNYVYQPQ